MFSKSICVSPSYSQRKEQILNGIKEICTFDVVIIGAGSSGIAAARYLQKINNLPGSQNQIKPIRFLVIEARDRVGGRCYNSGFNGISIDWGGKWIHGSCNKNPMRRLMNELRQQKCSNNLPVDVPKWFKSKTCFKIYV